MKKESAKMKPVSVRYMHNEMVEVLPGIARDVPAGTVVTLASSEIPRIQKANARSKELGHPDQYEVLGEVEGPIEVPYGIADDEYDHATADLAVARDTLLETFAELQVAADEYERAERALSRVTQRIALTLAHEEPGRYTLTGPRQARPARAYLATTIRTGAANWADALASFLRGDQRT